MADWEYLIQSRSAADSEQSTSDGGQGVDLLITTQDISRLDLTGLRHALQGATDEDVVRLAGMWAGRVHSTDPGVDANAAIEVYDRTKSVIGDIASGLEVSSTDIGDIDLNFLAGMAEAMSTLRENL